MKTDSGFHFILSSWHWFNLHPLKHIVQKIQSIFENAGHFQVHFITTKEHYICGIIIYILACRTYSKG